MSHAHVGHVLVFAVVAVIAGTLAACTNPTVRSATQSGSASRTSSAPRTIAVLPFAMPANPANASWFTTGFSRELIRVLGHNPHLRVTAWNSAQHFTDSTEPAGGIGKTLGVQALLRGTLASAGSQLVIFVKLIATDSGATLWSGSFSGATADLAAAETQIAQRVARALKVPAAPASKLQPPAANAHLMVLYARAALWNANSYQKDAAARGDAQKAIKLDPKYAEAYALVAQSWMAIAGNMPGTMQASAALPNARAAAHKALALDPDNVDALYALGNADFGSGQPSAAMPLYKRALAIDPSYSRAWVAAGDVTHSLVTSRNDFAAAVRLDPFDATAQNNLADAYLDLGQYRQALPAAVAYRTQQPHVAAAAFLLALDETLLGHRQAAITAFDILPPHRAFDRQLDAAGKLAYRALAQPALRTQAVAAVKALGSWSNLDPVSLESVMQAELALGERTQVLAQLPHLCTASPVSCVDLGSFPLWSPLHGDPQFQALVKKYNTMSGGRTVATRAP